MKEYKVIKNEVTGSDVLTISDLKEERVVKVIDSHTTVNSGLSWGYGGGGPLTLTTLLFNEVCGPRIFYNETHNEVFESLSTFVKNYDQNTDFVVTSEQLEKILKHGSIETYKFQHYDELFKNTMKFIDEKLSGKTSDVLTLFRINMPYCITIAADRVSFQNRDYEGLGTIKNTTHTSLLDKSVETNMTRETIEYIIENSKNIDTVKNGYLVYLYNDDTKPWDSKANLTNYLVRFNDIISKLTGNEYYPITVDTNASNFPSKVTAWKKVY